MKKGVVKFSKEFVTEIGLKEWVGIEMEYDMSSECPKEILTNANILVNQWHSGQNPHLQPQGPPPYDGNSFPGPRVIEVKPEDREIGLTPELIMTCNDIVSLQSFYMLVDKSNRVDLKEAYDKRKDELRIKETKEILDATEKETMRKRTNNLDK